MNILFTLVEIAIDYWLEIFVGILLSVVFFFGTGHMRRQYLKNNKIESGIVRETALLFFFMYCGCISTLLLLPPNFLDIFSEGQTSITATANYEFNLVPTIFLYITGAYSSGMWVYAMFIGNIIIFIPFGVFIQLLWETVSVKKFFVIDFLVIMIIETIQPFIGRSFDSNDIILNIFGSLLGFGMASLLNKYVPKFVSVFRYQRH